MRCAAFALVLATPVAAQDLLISTVPVEACMMQETGEQALYLETIERGG